MDEILITIKTGFYILFSNSLKGIEYMIDLFDINYKQLLNGNINFMALLIVLMQIIIIVGLPIVHIKYKWIGITMLLTFSIFSTQEKIKEMLPNQLITKSKFLTNMIDIYTYLDKDVLFGVSLILSVIFSYIITNILGLILFIVYLSIIYFINIQFNNIASLLAYEVDLSTRGIIIMILILLFFYFFQNIMIDICFNFIGTLLLGLLFEILIKSQSKPIKNFLNELKENEIKEQKLFIWIIITSIFFVFQKYIKYVIFTTKKNNDTKMQIIM